jgi:hypothetical protein
MYFLSRVRKRGARATRIWGGEPKARNGELDPSGPVSPRGRGLDHLIACRRRGGGGHVRAARCASVGDKVGGGWRRVGGRTFSCPLSKGRQASDVGTTVMRWGWRSPGVCVVHVDHRRPGTGIVVPGEILSSPTMAKRCGPCLRRRVTAGLRLEDAVITWAAASHSKRVCNAAGRGRAAVRSG